MLQVDRSTHLVLFFLERLTVSEVGRVAASMVVFYQVVRPDYRNVQPNLTTTTWTVPGTYLAIVCHRNTPVQPECELEAILPFSPSLWVPGPMSMPQTRLGGLPPC